MLQQILRDMFIDPELLAELEDEQKQVLYCKMREEQVRRWKEREKKLDDEEKKPKKKHIRENGRKVTVGFRSGDDGEPWTWVMGEHKDDKTIEQLLEEDVKRISSEQAEQEAEQLRDNMKKSSSVAENGCTAEKGNSSEQSGQVSSQNVVKCQARVQEEAEIARQAEEEKRRLQEEARTKQLELKKQKEAEKEKHRKSELARLEQEKQDQLSQLQQKSELRRRHSIDMFQQMKNRRSIEIYATLKKEQEERLKNSEQVSEQADREWQEQERKAKAAEVEIQSIARNARIEHRRSMSGDPESIKKTTSILGSLAESATCSGTDKPPVPTRPTGIKSQPPKPANRTSIINWYRKTEYARGAGIDASTGKVADWFHGIISRQAAEDLLEDASVGTFLVRVSERIWGYTISYAATARCKHFLIDTSGSTYQFFGVNQIQHPSLADLVEFHKTRPISSSGGELLKDACTVQPSIPDYQDLLEGLHAMHV